MQAYAIDAYGSSLDLVARELPTPEPARGEVRVQIAAAALNPADLKVASGKDGGRFLHAAHFPLVLGFDYAGVVESLGPETAGVEVGEPVFGFLPYARSTRQGSLGEFLTVPVSQLGRKPPHLTYGDAAALATAGATALQSLRDRGGLRAGQRVLILGASGGVGTCAVQIAKALGAGHVVATCSDAKRAAVLQLGANHTLDYHAVDVRTANLTAVEGPFDVVFDVASKYSFVELRRHMAPKGRYVTLLPSAALLWGKLRSVLDSRSCTFTMVRPRPEDFGQLAAWHDEGALRAIRGATFAWNDTPAALRELQRGTHVGKVVVAVRPGMV